MTLFVEKRWQSLNFKWKLSLKWVPSRLVVCKTWFYLFLIFLLSFQSFLQLLPSVFDQHFHVQFGGKFEKGSPGGRCRRPAVKDGRSDLPGQVQVRQAGYVFRRPPHRPLRRWAPQENRCQIPFIPFILEENDTGKSDHAFVHAVILRDIGFFCKLSLHTLA